MRVARFETADPLVNLKFQDFLAGRKVMVKADLEPEDFELIRRRSKLLEVPETVWGFVKKKPGYLVSSRLLTSVAFGSSGQGEMDAMYKAGKGLRGRFRSPDKFTVKTVGQGIGVESLNISSGDVLLPIYCGWEDIGKFVSAKVLAEKLYGQADPNAVENTISRFNRLGGLVSPFDIAVEGADFNQQRFYRLREMSKIEPKRENYHPVLRGIFGSRYQEWLGKVGAIEYSHPMQRVTLKEGESFSTDQAAVIRLLNNLAPNVITYDWITKELYGGEVQDRLQEKLAGIMHRIKSKCVNPDILYVSYGMGWAVGVTDVRLRPAQWKQLNILWQNESEFVPATELVVDKTSFEGDEVSDTRKVIAGGDYLVGSRRVGKRLDYILAHNSELVHYRPKAA